MTIFDALRRLWRWRVPQLNSGIRTQMNRFALLIALLLPLAQWAMAETINGKVVGVMDGDTIKVLAAGNVQHKVRLVEIDAPESRQPYGSRAKQALSGLVFGKSVQVESSGRDRYGRVLGRVYVGSLDINRELIRLGAAWAYRDYLTDKTLLQVESEARSDRRGLWALPESQRIPPHQWRRSTREVAALPTSGGCGTKSYCKQMTNCAEARQHLACGVSTLDGDEDGVPCEALCQ